MALTKIFSLIANRLRRRNDRDYVSKGLIYAPSLHHFPNRIVGDRLSVAWPFFRKTKAHKWYTDKRYPYIGFLNADESSILHSAAKNFKGERAIEIGCWRGWSAYQIVTAEVSSIDVVDPVFEDPSVLNEVRSLLNRFAIKTKVSLHPGRSPDAVNRLAAEGRRYAFAFIDGDHDGPGPLNDAIATLPAMEQRAMIVFHDLMAPDVAAALDFARAEGWRTRIYQTNQIMGIAWRGDVHPPEHVPDPKETWELPDHLTSYIAG